MNTIKNLNKILNHKSKKSHCDNACESQRSEVKSCFICHKSGHFAYECPEKKNRKKYRFLFKRDEDKFRKNLIKLVMNLNNFLSKKGDIKIKNNFKKYDVNANKKGEFYFRNLIELNEESEKEIRKEIFQKKEMRIEEFKKREKEEDKRIANVVKSSVCLSFIRGKIQNFKIYPDKSKEENLSCFLKIKINNEKFFNQELKDLFEKRYKELSNELDIKRRIMPNNKLEENHIEIKEDIKEKIGEKIQEKKIIEEEEKEKENSEIKEKIEKDNKEKLEKVKKDIKEEIKKEENKEIIDIKGKLDKFQSKEILKKDPEELSVISSVSSVLSSASTSSISKEELEEYKRKRYNEKRRELLKLSEKSELNKNDLLKMLKLISDLMKSRKIFENEVQSFKKFCKDSLKDIAAELNMQNNSHCRNTTVSYG